MSRQTQNSKMAAEGGFGSLPDPRRQTKRRGDKQEASSKVKAVPPTQEEVDAAAKEKYEPQVNAYVTQLEKDRDEKIAKIQRNADQRIAEAEKKNDAAAREKIAKIQRDADERIAKAERKMKLRQDINDARSAATGPRSYVTNGSVSSAKSHLNFETGEDEPDIPYKSAVHSGVVGVHDTTQANFPGIRLPTIDGGTAVAQIVFKRGQDTRTGYNRVWTLTGRATRAKLRGSMPFYQADAETMALITADPRVIGALEEKETQDTVSASSQFKGLSLGPKESARSQASKASCSGETN